METPKLEQRYGVYLSEQQHKARADANMCFYQPRPSFNMLASIFVASVALFLFILAGPAFALDRISVPRFHPLNFLCGFRPFPSRLCPSHGNGLNIVTPLGIARGVSDPDGASRFAVRYAKAARWQPSSPVTTWDLPNGSTNVSALPLACPQPDLDPSAYTEDCLSMVLYVPPLLDFQSSASTVVWIPGGSFVVGSASGAGLDGSRLALATNSIVAVIQHRLGAFGFLPPNGQNNLAVKDVVTALNFLQQILPFFGGCSSKITIAGQSSGATMVRSLLAVPSASSLFRSGILQSDPMDFGFLRPVTQNALQNYFISQTACPAGDMACLIALDIPSIITAQMATFNAAATIDPAAGQNEPLRPMLDGSFITAPLDLSGAFPTQNKPLLITTVAQEAGLAIYTIFPQPLPQVALRSICLATFGADRTDIILANPLYAPVVASDGSCDIRAQLEEIGTDYLWRCSSWSFARSWVKNGGTAFVGEYVVGATYPGNGNVAYCTQPGIVCHQDDIEIVFGTVPNPTPAQSALTSQMQSRYKSFLNNGNPNGNGLPYWIPATASDVHPILLGGSGAAPIGACSPNFWGAQVQYDYQYYNH